MYIHHVWFVFSDLPEVGKGFDDAVIENAIVSDTVQ
jgi:hypothetical protein